MFLQILLAAVCLYTAASLPIKQAKQDCWKEADLVFVLDASDSIDPLRFRQELDFVVSVVHSFGVSHNGIHAGVVVYSKGVLVPVMLGRVNSINELETSLYGVSQEQDGTHTSRGIATMLDQFSRHGRHGVPYIGIVVTDGRSKDAVFTAGNATEAKSRGIHMFSVGVGRKIDLKELATIATSPSNQLFVDDFNQLYLVAGSVATSMCSTPPISPVTTPRSPKSCHQDADIIFLLDASDSILPHQFQQELQFVIQTTERFLQINPSVRIGVVVYSKSVIVPVQLGRSDSVTKLKALLKDVVQEQHGTHTSLGLSTMLEQFRQYGRQNVQYIGVVVTDGKSKRPFITAANAAKLKRNGVELFAVGVGQKVMVDELENISSGKENVIFVRDFQKLLGSLHVFENLICKASPTTTAVTRETIPVGTCYWDADIIFLLDASDSIYPHQFQQELDFVLLISERFLQANPSVQIGVVIYSKSVVVAVPLGRADNIGKIKQLLKSVVQEQHGTHTSLGLSTMLEQFQKYGRRSVQYIGIVVTDGKSKRPIVTATNAAKLKQNGVDMFAVGVGQKVMITELESISSRRENVIFVKDFQTLLQSATVFGNLICKSTTTTPVVTQTNPTVCWKEYDAIFVLDASDSILPHEFQQQLDFVVKVAEGLRVTNFGIRIGIVIYSKQVLIPVQLGQASDITKLKALLGGIEQEQHGTHTSLGIAAMRSQFLTYGRPGVPHIGIVITDGQSKRPDLTAANSAKARQQGIHMFSVGVGRKVNIGELRAISSTVDSLIYVRDFSQLVQSADGIGKLVCEATTSTSSSSSTDHSVDVIERADVQNGGGCRSTCTKYLKISATVVTVSTEMHRSLTVSTVSASPPTSLPSPCWKEADVVFVLDASDSILSNQFELELNFVTNVVSSFQPGLQTGVVIFSQNVMVPLQLGSYTNVDDLSSRLRDVIQEQHGTYTSRGIQEMLRQFTKYGRQNVPSIAVVVTDGKSKNPGETASLCARAKRDHGINIFAVGVGSKVDTAELEEIASGKENIVSVQGFDQLLDESDNVRNLLCSPPATTPVRTDSTSTSTSTTASVVSTTTRPSVSPTTADKSETASTSTTVNSLSTTTKSPQPPTTTDAESTPTEQTQPTSTSSAIIPPTTTLSRASTTGSSAVSSPAQSTQPSSTVSDIPITTEPTKRSSTSGARPTPTQSTQQSSSTSTATVIPTDQPSTPTPSQQTPLASASTGVAQITTTPAIRSTSSTRTTSTPAQTTQSGLSASSDIPITSQPTDRPTSSTRATSTPSSTTIDVTITSQSRDKSTLSTRAVTTPVQSASSTGRSVTTENTDMSQATLTDATGQSGTAVTSTSGTVTNYPTNPGVCSSSTYQLFEVVGNCRRFWMCLQGERHFRCCPEGYTFYVGFGCYLDFSTSCMDVCNDPVYRGLESSWTNNGGAGSQEQQANEGADGGETETGGDHLNGGPGSEEIGNHQTGVGSLNVESSEHAIPNSKSEGESSSEESSEETQNGGDQVQTHGDDIKQNTLIAEKTTGVEHQQAYGFDSSSEESSVGSFAENPIGGGLTNVEQTFEFVNNGDDLNVQHQIKNTIESENSVGHNQPAIDESNLLYNVQQGSDVYSENAVLGNGQQQDSSEETDTHVPSTNADAISGNSANNYGLNYWWQQNPGGWWYPTNTGWSNQQHWWTDTGNKGVQAQSSEERDYLGSNNYWNIFGGSSD